MIALSGGFTQSWWCRSRAQSSPLPWQGGRAPPLAVTWWHTQPLRTLCAGGLHRQLQLGISSRKETQLLNLQPSLHREMRYNCNTAVRSVICPVAAVGIARDITASPTFLPAGIAGMCVTWVVAQILFLKLCQSTACYAHLFSKRDMIHPAQYKWLLITCLLSLFKYS